MPPSISCQCNIPFLVCEGTRNCVNPTTVECGTTEVGEVVDFLARSAPVTCRSSGRLPHLPISVYKPQAWLGLRQEGMPVTVTTTELPLNPTDEIGAFDVDSAHNHRNDSSNAHSDN